MFCPQSQPWLPSGINSKPPAGIMLIQQLGRVAELMSRFVFVFRS